MSRKIWNEGRVVGYGQYETYVRQHLLEDPSTPPATEREWLAASIGSGSALMLKVPDIGDPSKPDELSYIDIPLPQGTRLTAANSIMATFFEGDGTFNSTWASNVSDYGQLIANMPSKSPTGESRDQVPTQDLQDWSQEKKNKLRDYMKIVDGLALQPGTWTPNDSKPPEKDFQPNLKKPGWIRLLVKGAITTSPIIILTGFTIRSILIGTCGTDSSVNTLSPQDGDFLGPAAFPWANKITFSVPTSYIAYFEASAYTRNRPNNDPETVRDNPVIDMKFKADSGSNPAPVAENYYANAKSTDAVISGSTETKQQARVDISVKDYTTLGDGVAVLSTFQKKDVYPPAMYSTFVSAKGQNFLHPLDVVAPGTVKMFKEVDGVDPRTTIIEYQQTFPGTTGIVKNKDGSLVVVNNKNELVDVCGLEIDYINSAGESSRFATPVGSLSGTSRPKVVKIKAGAKSAYALAMCTDIGKDLQSKPAELRISKLPSSSISLTNSNSDSNLTWSALLHALTNDESIDILQQRLKNAKDTLTNSRTSSSGPYLEFGPESSPLRLYITDTQPSATGVPVGSIGIGWGFEGDK